MTRMPIFDSPFLVGFDQFERVLDRVAKSSAEGYPPYNIEQIAEDQIRISLAVAGFSMNDLEVTIEDNQLVIRGRQTEEDSDRIFLHRGIAGRQFQRSFVLADGVDVTSARMEDGLLHVDLRLPIPEPKVTKIEIAGPSGKDKDAQTIDLSPDKN